MPHPLRIGTAGWAVPKHHREPLPAAGTQLQLYAQRLACTEINSSFHRPHRRATYERWAAATPAHFRFAVKLPKTISHTARLSDCIAPLERFLGEAGGLGDKLAVLLLQLPPSFSYDARLAGDFFAELRARTALPVACEPRHPSWFAPAAEALFTAARIARVAADPAPLPAASLPGGWPGLCYWRLHGSPRIYWSDYEAPALAQLAAALELARRTAESWCIFDNTARQAAFGNALTLAADLDR